MRIVLIIFSIFVSTLSLKEIRPVIETPSDSGDTDDPAIWINPKDRAQSLIIGTIKEPAPAGALAVYSLDGRLVERVDNIDRPNNVDIQGDICVVTERLKRQLRVYRVFAVKPHLRLVGTAPVFEGEQGESGAPMGIGLYERPKDKALFAVVSRKTGPETGYLWQYRIRVSGNTLNITNLRKFGVFSGDGEIEAVAVDDSAGLVYYSDEDCCVRVYKADPEASDAGTEIARFAESGFRSNREGIAITGDRIIVTDQLPDGSEYHVYNRADRRELEVWKGTAESTDGIEAIGVRLNPEFPNGFLVVMNSGRHNFQIYGLPR